MRGEIQATFGPFKVQVTKGQDRNPSSQVTSNRSYNYSPPALQALQLVAKDAVQVALPASGLTFNCLKGLANHKLSFHQPYPTRTSRVFSL